MLWASKRGWRLVVVFVVCLAIAIGCKRAKPSRTVSWPTPLPIPLEPTRELESGAQPLPAAPVLPTVASGPGALSSATPALPATPSDPTAVPTKATAPTPQGESQPQSEVEYAIAPGDTLSSVAAGFETSVAAIMQRNGLTNPDLVRVGQALIIPVGSGTSSPSESGTVYHTAGQGDTLWKLARRYRTHPREIVAQNEDLISNPDDLSPGTILKITVGTAPVVATHTVRPGESLSSIARANGVSFQDLLSANGLANPNLVRAGQVLVIPK